MAFYRRPAESWLGSLRYSSSRASHSALQKAERRKVLDLVILCPQASVHFPTCLIRTTSYTPLFMAPISRTQARTSTSCVLSYVLLLHTCFFVNMHVLFLFISIICLQATPSLPRKLFHSVISFDATLAGSSFVCALPGWFPGERSIARYSFLPVLFMPLVHCLLCPFCLSSPVS